MRSSAHRSREKMPLRHEEVKSARGRERAGSKSSSRSETSRSTVVKLPSMTPASGKPPMRKVFADGAQGASSALELARMILGCAPMVLGRAAGAK
jgi:hypothetical protein